MKLSYIPLFRWNEKRLAPSRSRIIPNVEQYVQSLDGVGCSEYFGLGFRIQELPVSEIDSSNCNSEVILDGDSTVCDDDGETEDDLPAEEEDIVISKEQIERAVIRVDNIVSITNHILHLGENLRFNTNYVTLLKSALCLLACQENRPSAETMSNLAANLTAYKLEIVSSTDNCLFTVMRNALSEVWTDELQAAFGQLDSLPLQKIVAQELRGDQDGYSQLMLNKQASFSEIVQIESATTSELIHCVPLALCNYLRIPVIIFTGMLNFPLIPLVPSVPVVSTQPMYIGFDSAGVQFLHIRREQHVRNHQANMMLNVSAPDASAKPCRCGAGASKAKDKSSCVGIRCKCAQAGNSCRDCHCLNCANPFGQREDKSANTGPVTPRKRRRHSKAYHQTDLQFVTQSREAGVGERLKVGDGLLVSASSSAEESADSLLDWKYWHKRWTNWSFFPVAVIL